MGIMNKLIVIFLIYVSMAVTNAADQTPPNEITFEQPVEIARETIEKQPETLLTSTLLFYRQVTDYTGTFVKQERIDGRLGDEQVIDFKFKTNPHSILMEWKKNAGKIDKLLYVENQNDNKALLHPDGLLSWIKSVKRAPDDEDIMKSTLKPCTEFGFAKIAKSMLADIQPEEGNPKATLKFIESKIADDTTIVKLEQIYANPKEGAVAKILITYDMKLMAPVERKAYDSDNNLLYSYVYNKLKLNTHLTDNDFTPEANNL